MTILAKWFINALSLVLAAYIIPGIFVESLYTALMVAVLLGLVNIFIRPVLIILTLPITIITLGLFALVVNSLLFWFVSTFVEGFSVDGFVSAFLGALLISAFSSLGNKLIVKD